MDCVCVCCITLKLFLHVGKLHNRFLTIITIRVFPLHHHIMGAFLLIKHGIFPVYDNSKHYFRFRMPLTEISSYCAMTHAKILYKHNKMKLHDYVKINAKHCTSSVPTSIFQHVIRHLQFC